MAILLNTVEARRLGLDAVLGAALQFDALGSTDPTPFSFLPSYQRLVLDNDSLLVLNEVADWIAAVAPSLGSGVDKKYMG